MFQIRLKEIREKKNISQAQMAKMLDTKQSTVGMWESGKSFPRCAQLVKIAYVFDISLDYLLGNETPSKIIPDETETELIRNYRDLSDQGCEYIRQQMDIAMRIYKKSADLSGLESQHLKEAL